MRRFQMTLKRVIILIASVAVAVAMLARALTSWGPMNLVVLVAFVLTASAGLACTPRIPHRPFWAGLAGVGFLYLTMLWLFPAIFGLDPTSLPSDARKVVLIAAAQALRALILGVFGGCLLLYLAKVRESRRWDREALPERPLEDFLLPPLKIDPPLNPK